MGRFKIKKQDTFIDMTPMSDVMVLLLTFFMLTATFVKDEPVKVNVPGSVAEIKIPENNLLTIFVDTRGKVFISMDTPETQRAMIEQLIREDVGFSLNPKQLDELSKVPTFGTPLNTIAGWLELESAHRTEILLKNPEAGIPLAEYQEDGSKIGDDQLKLWVAAARKANGKNMGIAIKADSKTPYASIKKVMDSLRDVDENRYNLITTLKSGE
jgi:biopolymer transport protein ExbD